MPQPERTSPAPHSPPTDLLRAVRRVLTAAAVPAALAHDGEPCGRRASCPRQPADRPFRLLEFLPATGRIVALCGCHEGIYSPGDPGYDDLRRAFE